MDKLLTMPTFWAILPEQLVTTQHAYMAYLKKAVHGESVHLTQTANMLDVDIGEIPPTFFIDGNIAIMQIEGPITPKADIFSKLFGGSTIDVLTRDFKQLVADDNVKAIVIDIDSPGGVVHGAPEFANLVFEARAIKPVVAISGTVMASLAMWIGAAAEEIFITDETVVTGSLSALINHVDISGLEKEIGIKTTPIATGKYKIISSPFEPLTEEGRTELQAQVDHVTTALVSDIARFRGVDVDTVNSTMAAGRLFVGSQGIKAGLIDGIMGPTELIERINALVK